MVEQSISEYLKTSLSTDEVIEQPLKQNLFGTIPNQQLQIPQVKKSDKIFSLTNSAAAIEEFVHTQTLPASLEKYETEISNALATIKVLDPACGSGAFPIGVLQKIVALKQQLHPKTKNYKLKLDTIQNSIYGIDIQPMAVELSRLRCWLSLVVDEDSSDIKSLPNLDFKFVCANTLIDVPENEYVKNQSQESLTEFTIATAKYFNPDYTQKFKLKETIKRCLNKIISVHDVAINQIITQLRKEKNSASNSRLKQLEKTLLQYTNEQSIWHSYKNIFENKKVNFFNLHYFFPTVSEGFNIVIGNPPYVRADNAKFADLRKQIMDSERYKTLWEKWDLYVVFIERGFQLLCNKGILNYIIPDAYMASKYAKKSHSYFIENGTIQRINFCSEVKIFDAAVKNIIIQFSKDINPQNIPLRVFHKDTFENATILNSIPQIEFGENVFKLNQSNSIFDSIKDVTKWEEICYVSKGMVLQSDEVNFKGEFTKEDLITEIEDTTHPKKYLEAKWIKKYKIEKNKYLEWNTDRVPKKISRPTFAELYNPKKIIMGGMTGAIFDDCGFLCNHSCSISVLWEDLKGVENLSINNSVRKDFKVIGDKKALLNFKKTLEETSKKFSLKYLLSILNSKFGYYFLNINRRSQLGFYPDDLKQLPIKNIISSQQHPFIFLVNQLNVIKGNETSIHQYVSNNLIVKSLEDILDGMVLELYFEDEMKEKKITIIDFVTAAIAKTNSGIIEEDIYKFYSLVSHPDSEIRNRILNFPIASPTILKPILQG